MRANWTTTPVHPAANEGLPSDCHVPAPARQPQRVLPLPGEAGAPEGRRRPGGGVSDRVRGIERNVRSEAHGQEDARARL